VAIVLGSFATCLSVINFYFEHIKGAKVRAFAWNVQHEILGTRTGDTIQTVGKFAFANEGNKTTVITRVIMKLPTGNEVPVDRDRKGNLSFPIGLPPQETKFMELAVNHPRTDTLDPNYSFEFETYRQETKKVELSNPNPP
jgi:hypothetical protein